MHGLILRTLQIFTQDTYGYDTWSAIASEAGLENPDFEAMLHYDPAVLEAVLRAAETILNKPNEAFLEDVGTYLVSHPNCEGLRRLLRFGGVDFIEFLHSLDDLPDRARLAVADFTLPDVELRDHAGDSFELRLSGHLPGFGHVMVGLLRAMADDYGALALFEHCGAQGEVELITITLVETAYAEGRDFKLGAGTRVATTGSPV